MKTKTSKWQKPGRVMTEILKSSISKSSDLVLDKFVAHSYKDMGEYILLNCEWVVSDKLVVIHRMKLVHK